MVRHFASQKLPQHFRYHNALMGRHLACIAAQVGSGDDVGPGGQGSSEAGGSIGKTSRAAPARCPEANASARASPSTREARAVLMKQAPCFAMREASAVQHAPRSPAWRVRGS